MLTCKDASELLSQAQDRTLGLRTARRISHVYAIDAPEYPRALFVTDAAINIYPTLHDKRDIIQNAIDLTHALGIAHALVSDLDKLGGPLESLMAVKGPAILEIDMRKVGPFAAAYAGPPDGKASKGAA